MCQRVIRCTGEQGNHHAGHVFKLSLPMLLIERAIHQRIQVERLQACTQLTVSIEDIH
ncbi:hypothetical protein CUTA107171_01450 [Cupriavidus taiwanensis]